MSSHFCVDRNKSHSKTFIKDGLRLIQQISVVYFVVFRLAAVVLRFSIAAKAPLDLETLHWMICHRACKPVSTCSIPFINVA